MNISRESIFISAVRSFCNAFSAILGILIGLVVLGIFVGVLTKPPATSEKTTAVIVPDAEGNRELLPLTAPVILRINVHDVIGAKRFNYQTVLTELLDSRIGLYKNDRVKAILLHINSPGGTVTDSNNIYMALKRYKEKYNIPIYAYVDGLCASGAMYIACSADKIYSNPIGVIGSVGVILGPYFNFSGLMEKYGVKQLTLSEGKDKDMLNPYRPWDPNEDASLKTLTDYNYNHFVEVVISSRPKMDKNKLIQVYGAQVFDPPTAEQYGYIDDANGSYSTALTDLAKAANIEGNYQVVELKVAYPLLLNLMEANSPLFSGKITHEFELLPELRSELMNKPLYLYSPALQR